MSSCGRAAKPGCTVGTSSGTRARPPGFRPPGAVFAGSTNPTLRDVHEYITVWSKDQLKLERRRSETGVTGNQFVAWTRSIWRSEELLPELETKIADKLADARKRDKDDAWIAESIARAVWGQAAVPGESIWEMNTESAVDHPAPFPVELPKRLIALYTQPGDVVLDPFMGSGSTAIAATTDRAALRWV